MTPVELKMLDFQGDRLTALKDGNGDIFVQAAQVARNLGVSWATQHAKLKNNPNFESGMFMHMGTNGGVFIRIDLVPMWLASISPSKVSPRVYDKVILYHKSAAQFLSAAFIPPHLKPEARVEAEAKAIAQTQIPKVQAAGSALDRAAVHLATLNEMVAAMRENNLEIQTVKTTIGAQGQQIGQVELKVTDHDNRIKQVEAHTTGALGYLTIKAAAKRLEVPNISDTEAAKCGKNAAAICRARDLKIEKVRHEQYGEINSYPEVVALEAVAAWKAAKEQGH